LAEPKKQVRDKPAAPPKKAPPWYEYVQGGKSATGDIIREILAISDKSFVFIADDSSLQWEYDEKACVDGEKSIAEAADLLAQVKMCVPGLKGKRQANGLIGTALSHALEVREKGDTSDLFQLPREFIIARRSETLQLCYLASALGIMVVLLTTLAITAMMTGDSWVDGFLVAVGMGSLGAVVSVAQRFHEIRIERFSSRLYTSIGGMMRVVLGALFGAVILLFQKGGLVLSAVEQNLFAVAAVAFIAGFSERLIPDLVVRLEGQLSQPKGPVGGSDSR
jgi:hypothetical protein